MENENEPRIELSMQLLAVLCAEEIAEKENIKESSALNKFLQSDAALVLFDKSTGLWLNGPDYVTGEYYEEKARQAGK